MAAAAAVLAASAGSWPAAKGELRLLWLPCLPRLAPTIELAAVLPLGVCCCCCWNSELSAAAALGPFPVPVPLVLNPRGPKWAPIWPRLKIWLAKEFISSRLALVVWPAPNSKGPTLPTPTWLRNTDTLDERVLLEARPPGDERAIEPAVLPLEICCCCSRCFGSPITTSCSPACSKPPDTAVEPNNIWPLGEVERESDNSDRSAPIRLLSSPARCSRSVSHTWAPLNELAVDGLL